MEKYVQVVGSYIVPYNYIGVDFVNFGQKKIKQGSFVLG
jgi:hypothetical protein